MNNEEINLIKNIHIKKEKLDFRNSKSTVLETVMWFLPNFNNVLQGGVRTIFSTAEYCTINSNTFNIFVIYNINQSKINIDQINIDLLKNFPSLSFSIVVKDRIITDDLPYSNVAICTLWTTAYMLVDYSKCDRKYYFVQDYEPIFYSAGSIYGLIESTYRFGFECIANTKGVYDKYISYGNKGMYFNPSIDKEVFFNKERIIQNDEPIRIVIYGRPNNSRNGFLIVAEIVKQLKNMLNEKIKIISVGAEWNEKKYNLNGVVENLGILKSMEDVAELYRNSDFGICFMYTPHPSYQPFEYMASGCIPIVNNNKSNEWLLKDLQNCITVEPIPSLAVHKIMTIITNKKKVAEIKNNLSTTIKQYFDWDRTLSQIHKYLKGENVV
ncbi:glycosyltransferase [Aliarcobacter skirrowii]|uniref:glycosyltransferase n=1 Tax=Aliarcobacter skirrowii TaxID=28200 RepID=UPI0029A48015|nr:glycosyltransferase [Aliarcobacter skirrowii]MDX4026787.1 glycosyltransferase [Aliarcobacter skirrowii]